MQHDAGQSVWTRPSVHSTARLLPLHGCERRCTHGMKRIHLTIIKPCKGQAQIPHSHSPAAGGRVAQRRGGRTAQRAGAAEAVACGDEAGAGRRRQPGLHARRHRVTQTCVTPHALLRVEQLAAARRQLERRCCSIWQAPRSIEASGGRAVVDTLCTSAATQSDRTCVSCKCYRVGRHGGRRGAPRCWYGASE